MKVVGLRSILNVGKAASPFGHTSISSTTQLGLTLGSTLCYPEMGDGL